MKKAKKRFINNLLYLCLAGIIVIGLMTIIATGGGGDGVSFDYNEPEPDAEIMGIYYVEGDIEGDRVSWTLYEDEYYCLMMEISAYPASDHVMCVWDYYPSSATEPCASDCFDLDEQDAISITYYSCGKFDLEDNYDKYGWHRYEYKITDVDSDIYTFEMEIRPPKGSQGITNGTKTLMVTNPENAFDADPLTYATIPWYWGEAGHNDFLHFVAYVGFNRTFTFNISVNISTSGSTMTIDGETSSDIWEEIYSVSLNTATTETITVTNAQDYVNENGYISLRARWVGGDRFDDSYIYEIW